MSFQTSIRSKDCCGHEYQSLLQTAQHLRLFEATEDGIYAATSCEVVLRGSKIAKFDGVVRVLKACGGVLVAGDDQGSIKVIKESVLRRYKTCSAVVDAEFVETLKVAVVCEDNFLRVYEFQEELPIASMKFDERLRGVAHKQGVVAVLTERRLALLDVVRLEEIKTLHATGDGLCFLNDRKIALYSQNKVKVVDIETGDAVERRVHRCAISKIEAMGGLIYSLGIDGYIKAVDCDLNMLDCHVACGISYFAIEGNRILVLKDGAEVLVVAEKAKGDADEASYRVFEGMMKRYEYRGALLLALNGDDTRVLYRVLGHLFDINGLKQALSDYTLDHLTSIILVANRCWSWIRYTKINVEIAHVVLSDYVQFYTELKPHFDVLARNVADEMLFQQECCIVASFAEEMLD